MARVSFRCKEEGDVNIFNIPIDEHRQLCHKIQEQPAVYLIPYRQGMFYRHVSLKISKVTFNYYSEDTFVKDADLWEEGQIREIKDRQERYRQAPGAPVEVEADD